MSESFTAIANPLCKASRSLVEKHPNGYVAYPLGIEGIVVPGNKAE
jgi:hypothetical protein